MDIRSRAAITHNTGVIEHAIFILNIPTYTPKLKHFLMAFEHCPNKAFQPKIKNKMANPLGCSK